MRRLVGFLIVTFLLAVPMLVAQENTSDRFEAGIFAQYYRFNDPGPKTNFLGLGGRVAFGIRNSVQLEAEMGYDFERNYTNTSNNGISTSATNSRLRVLHGFFGPKFSANMGPLQVFATGKVGFDNFNVTGQGVPTGFASSVGLTSGATYFAAYPGVGIAAFAGPIGLRAEVGDDIFFNGGAHNNLRVTFGPQLRF